MININNTIETKIVKFTSLVDYHFSSMELDILRGILNEMIEEGVKIGAEICTEQTMLIFKDMKERI